MNGVFTVIVTYNATPWIKKSMRALLNSSIKTSIIVIDNASTDSTLAYLKEFEEHIHLIKNSENRGFGQANNQGIILALEQGAAHVFLMNQDVYVFKDTLELLTRALTEHPQFGILSAMQLKADGLHIDEKMQAYIRKNYSDALVKEFLTEDVVIDSIPLVLRFVNAAAWMMTRECILKTGLFHPAFYHYGEDNHYCSRMQYHKLNAGFLPSAKVIHDRKEEDITTIQALRKKIKTVPLYTLLDIRKPAPLALILGNQKLKSTYQKLKKTGDPEARQIYLEQKQWFSKNLSKSLQIRKETKKKWRTTKN